METTHNVGVIGCGYWGPNLIRNFRSLPDCNLAFVCDTKRERLAYLQTVYPGVKFTVDNREMIQDPDIHAIAIATPVFTHFDLARQSLLAGKHTFIEKPMASSSSQCEELIELAANRNLILMVGHTFIYSTPVRKIKEIVDCGDIGELLYISSQRLNLGLFQKDINVAWDLAPHDISIILYLTGEVPASVNSQGKAHFNHEIEDVATTTLNFKNGLIAFIHNSWLDPNKIRRTTFVGSKKMLVYDDIETQEKIKIYDKGVDVPPHYDSFADFHFSYRYGDIHSPRIDDYEPLKKECDHFLQCIRGEEYPWTDGYNGMRVVSILEAAGKSLKLSGMAVPVETYEREVKVRKGVVMRRNIQALIVNLNFFLSLDIIVNKHFFTAHKSCSSNFIGVEPTIMNESNHSIFEVQ